MEVKPGDLFRHYRVIAKVGEGGMGVVYRARDTKLDRDVALKFMTNASPLNTERGERLEGEARALAALNHPNILTIHEMGNDEGTPFLVLEWVGGGALCDQPFLRPLSMQDFLRVALPIADALGAAHERGIIHRDVKPTNVLVGEEGRIKLADFGLAKFRDPDDDATRTAGAIGTVAYMSPEQASGGTVGPASDVFAFGILAYELLAGQRPFGGPAPGTVIAAIVSQTPPPISQVRSGLTPALVDVIQRCLEKQPERRFQNGKDLARALRRAFTESAISDPPTKTTSADPTRIVGSPDHQQEIRFCTTSDGVAIAYSAVGSGPPIVRVLGHFTHLEKEWEWPDLRRFWEFLAARHTVVRYDGRGMGLSDPYTGEFSEETRQLDLDAVLAAVGATHTALLGISEGGWTAASYTLKHPERITHLVLYGAYCRGARARPGYDEEEDRALVTLMRKGWGRDTPAFRQVFTSQFFREDASPGLIAHFNELQRVSADADTAARYHESAHRRGDGREMFQQLRVPTLVMHCRDDMAVRADEGRLLASIIPGAQLVLLPSGTHYFPTDTVVITKAADAITRFIQTPATRK